MKRVWMISCTTVSRSALLPAAVAVILSGQMLMKPDSGLLGRLYLHPPPVSPQR